MYKPALAMMGAWAWWARPLMQSLLEDRFHLKLHRATRNGLRLEPDSG